MNLFKQQLYIDYMIYNCLDYTVIEEPKSCPELEAIEWRCRNVDNLAGDTSRMLYVPCVKLQICKACVRPFNLYLFITQICDPINTIIQF